MSCWFFKSLLPFDTYLKHFCLGFQDDKASTAVISLNAMHGTQHMYDSTNGFDPSWKIS
jgi:hypothetical protein